LKNSSTDQPTGLITQRLSSLDPQTTVALRTTEEARWLLIAY
jgi:hypothetical protein